VSRRAECPFDDGLEVVELDGFDEMLGEASLQLRSMSPLLPKPLIAIPGTLIANTPMSSSREKRRD
jgi:hypothetical protein